MYIFQKYLFLWFHQGRKCGSHDLCMGFLRLGGISMGCCCQKQYILTIKLSSHWLQVWMFETERTLFKARKGHVVVLNKQNKNNKKGDTAHLMGFFTVSVCLILLTEYCVGLKLWQKTAAAKAKFGVRQNLNSGDYNTNLFYHTTKPTSVVFAWCLL